MKNGGIIVVALVAFFYIESVHSGLNGNLASAQSAVQASQIFNEATAIFTYVGAVALLLIAVEVSRISSFIGEIAKSIKEGSGSVIEKAADGSTKFDIPTMNTQATNSGSVTGLLSMQGLSKSSQAAVKPAIDENISATPAVAVHSIGQSKLPSIERKCPHCNQAIRSTDIYCGSCGTNVGLGLG